jgi:hypothetical protein
MNQIQNFWDWFSHNKDRFVHAKDNRLFLDLIQAKLNEVDKGLFFEMSLDSNPKEFIVTAGGDKKLFFLADEVVLYAPKLSGWRFISLKPPRGFQFISNFRGSLFDPRKMWFMPFKKRDDPAFLGLRIGFENGCGSMEKEIVRNGTLLVLDTGLGERVAAMSIRYLEIVELPANPRACGYGNVTELPEYISKLNLRQHPM